MFPLSYRCTVLCNEKGCQPNFAAAVLISKNSCCVVWLERSRRKMRQVSGNISSSIVVKEQSTISAFILTQRKGEHIVFLSETVERSEIKSENAQI